MARGVEMDWSAFFDDEEVQRLLSRMIAEGRDLRPVFKKIAAMKFGEIKQTFRQQGRPVKWKGLAPLTIALRRKGGATGKPQILRDTGYLFTSVTSPHARDSIFKTSPDTLVIGTRREGAVHHQRGRPAHDETWQVDAHRRKAHARGAVKVKAHNVRAHSKVMHFGRMPKRVFLQWRPDDTPKAIRIIIDALTGGPGVLTGAATARA